jgi:hypothetical protein
MRCGTEGAPCTPLSKSQYLIREKNVRITQGVIARERQPAEAIPIVLAIILAKHEGDCRARLRLARNDTFHLKNTCF